MLFERKKRTAAAVLCFVLTVALCTTMFPTSTYACHIDKIKIYKYDKDDRKASMNGTKFIVKEKDGKNWKNRGTITIGSDGYGSLSGHFGKGTYRLVESYVLPGYKDDAIKWSSGDDTPSISSDGTFKVDGDLNGGTFIFKASNEKEKYKGKIKVYKYYKDCDKEKPLQGAKFYLKDSKGNIVKKNSETYFATSGINGYAEWENLDKGTYTVWEDTAPIGFIKITTSKETTLTDTCKEKTVKFENKKKFNGKIKVFKYYKKDDKEKPLAGAKFYLKKDGKIVVNDKGQTYYATSDNYGYAKWENLEKGIYTLFEESAPANYVKIVGQIGSSVEINSDSKWYEFTKVKNEKIPKYGSAKIYKIDKDTKKPLQGVIFKLQKKNSKGIYVDYTPVGWTTKEVATGADGYARFDKLESGDYKFVEVKSLSGYEGTLEFSNDTGKFTIKADEETCISLTATNIKKVGKVNLKKIDGDNSNIIIKDAKFYIKNVDTNATYAAVFNSTTNYYEWKDIPWGTYTVHESEAGLGYDLKSFTVTEGLKDGKFVISKKNYKETIKLKATNKQIKGEVFLEKIDSTSESPISGASFYLSKGKNTTTQKINGSDRIIGASGATSWAGLEWGWYTLVEDNPAKGYSGDLVTTGDGIDEDNSFYVGPLNGKSQTTFNIVAKNDRLTGSFELLKYDNQEKLLSGVSFVLTYPDGTTETLITDAEGEISKAGLEWGDYNLKELVPDGYYEDKADLYGPEDSDIDEDGNFTIGPEKLNFGFNAINYMIPGDIEIYKVDNHGKAVAGVEFLLKDADDDSTVETLVTDENGYTSIDGIEWGNYQLVESDKEGYDMSKVEITGDGIDEDGYFTVDATKRSFRFDVTNYQIPGNLFLYKYDSEVTTTALTGAVFSLEKQDDQGNWIPYTDASGTAITATTDENGMAAFFGLEWGVYRVIEDQAPLGYDKNTLKFEGDTNIVTVGPNSEELMMIAFNTKTTVEGEEVVPTDGGGVLGEEEKPDDGDVLGEEAKTSDEMSAMAYMIVLLVMAIAVAVITRRREQQ